MGLTPRELLVMERIAAGDSNKEIARRMGITVSTVAHMTSSIYRKLDVFSRTQAVRKWSWESPGAYRVLIEAEGDPPV